MRSLRCLACWAIAVLLAASGVAATASAEVRQAPSSRIAIDLPEAFVASRQFTGFVDQTRGVSFVVVELPGAAYEQLAVGLTPEALAAKGISNAAAARLERQPPYLYMRGEQDSGQGRVAKFLVAFRDKDVTALITANAQMAALERGAVLPEEIERALASATIAPIAAPARELFRLKYLGPFLPAGSILGTTQAYTLDGRLGPGSSHAARPILIVAPSLDQRSLADPEAQAETLIRGLPGLKELTFVERRRTALAGMDAVELSATAIDSDTGEAVSLYQVVLLPPAGGYFRILGQVPVSEDDRLLPELRKVAKGFETVDN